MLALRWLILLSAAAGIAAWLWWGRRYPQYSWLIVAPISWLVHVSLFHVSRLLAIPIPAEYLNQWSIAIHLHALILLACAPLIYTREDMRNG